MKAINEFILEQLENVNESVASTTVEGWLDQFKGDWNRHTLMRSYQWDKITDDDLVWHDQAEAKKLAYKRNESWTLFWVNDNDKLVAMTNSNYSWFVFPSSGFYEYKIKSIMPIVRACKGAYSIDDKFSTKALRQERATAKENATALMDNEKIKEQNLKRYEKILKDTKIKDGSLYTGIKARFDEVTEKYKALFEEIGSASEEDFGKKMNDLKDISSRYTDIIYRMADVMRDYNMEKAGSPWSLLKEHIQNLDDTINRFNLIYRDVVKK